MSFDPIANRGVATPTLTYGDPDACRVCYGLGCVDRTRNGSGVESYTHGICHECGRVALVSDEPIAPAWVSVMIRWNGDFMLVSVPPREPPDKAK